MRIAGWSSPFEDESFVPSPAEKLVLTRVAGTLDDYARAPVVEDAAAGATLSGPWRLLPHLVLGDLFHALDTSLLRRIHVTHVLNLAPQTVHTGRAFYTSRGLKGAEYKQLQCTDDLRYNIARVFPECHDFVDRARDHGGVAFVHCHAGVNRSVAVVAAYIMRHLQRPVPDVVDYIQRLRCAPILTNRSFLKQLARYAAEHDLLLASPDDNVDT